MKESKEADSRWFGYVYLLQCGAQYKIGFSNKPRKRLKQLRTGSPYPVFLIHSIKTEFYQMVEKQLHHKFREKRGEGEWFRLTDEDVAYIRSLNKLGRTPEEQEQADRDRAAHVKAYQDERAATCRAEAREAIAVVAGV